MNLSHLKYPRKSHRKKVIIPEECELLAEFLGIVFGDGGIHHNHQFVISLNAIKDRSYSEYVANAVFKLFGIKPYFYHRKKYNTLNLVVSSTSVVEFLIVKGAVRGNKILQGLSIPEWVLANRKYCRAFVRGLVDTDRCLYIHNHVVKGKRYFNLGFCFTSKSSKLILQVSRILRENGFGNSISKGGCDVYMYSAKNIISYLDIIGTSNARIYDVYTHWRGVRVV